MGTYSLLKDCTPTFGISKAVIDSYLY